MVPTSPDQERQALLRNSGQTVGKEAYSQAGWVSEPCNEPGLRVTVAK